MSRLGTRGLPLLRHLLKRGVSAKPQEFGGLEIAKHWHRSLRPTRRLPGSMRC